VCYYSRVAPEAAEALDLEDPAWTSFVSGHVDAMPFHHPAWARAVSDTYGLRPFALVMRDDAGRVAAGLPMMEVGRRRRRWVSLPFTDACPPLGALPDLGERLEAVRRERGLRALEVRGEVPDGGHAVPEGHVHVTALDPEPEAVFSRLQRQRQRNIKRAEQAGCVTVVEKDSPALERVFFHLHSLTRKRLGVPVQPRRFFAAIQRHVIEGGLAVTLVTRYRDEPVAAGLLLTWNGWCVLKFSASDRRFSDVRPTDALMATALRWSCQNGYVRFDLGRTELGNEGLRAFKLGWGGVERELSYTTFADAAPEPGHGRAEQLLGVVLRHSPTWVARAVGAVAYRYAA
jgi:CelD/BcsL family acetyltransferase involved in cellulose biosynthesis